MTRSRPPRRRSRCPARARVRLGGRERGTAAGCPDCIACTRRAGRVRTGDGSRDELGDESRRARRPPSRASRSICVASRESSDRTRGRRSAAAWLGVPSARRSRSDPAQSGSVTIASNVPARAEPGDHDALVLFTTRRRVRDGLAVRVRMGVVVVVRAPGEVVRRLALRGLRAVRTRRGRLLELVVVNRGNVTESFTRGRTVVSVERDGRRLARLTADGRSLRPGTRGVLQFPLRRRLRGNVLARVDLVSGCRSHPARISASTVRVGR